MNRPLLVLACGLALCVTASTATAFDPLQRAERAAQQAQRSLAAGDTFAAVESMLQAQALAPDDPRIRSGLAELLYAGGEHEPPAPPPPPPPAPPPPPPQRPRAPHNAGNAAFRQQDYETALELYTAALLEGDSAPSADLLHNLELAQRLQQQQEQQRQQSEESGEEGEPQEGEQPPEDQEAQDGQEPPENEQPPEQEPQSEDQQAPPDSTGQQPPPPQDPQEAGADSTQAPPPPPDLEQMTPEEAMRLLEALDYDEQQLRESIQRRLRGAEEEDENDW